MALTTPAPWQKLPCDFTTSGSVGFSKSRTTAAKEIVKFYKVHIKCSSWDELATGQYPGLAGFFLCRTPANV